MKKDDEPIVWDFPKGRNVRLKILGDLHLGSPLFNRQAFEDFKGSITKDTKIIVVGDLIDNGVMGSPGMYEQTMQPSEAKELLYQELLPFKKNILCAVPGNHELRSRKICDSDIMYDVFARLQIEDLYRPNEVYMCIRIGHKQTTNHKKRPTYAIYVTHGSGGGSQIGTYVNKAGKVGMCREGIDLVVMGHSHSPVVFPRKRIVFDTHNLKVTKKPFRVVICPSFLDYGGYAARANYEPSAYVNQDLVLHADEKAIGYSDEVKL